MKYSTKATIRFALSMAASLVILAILFAVIGRFANMVNDAIYEYAWNETEGTVTDVQSAMVQKFTGRVVLTEAKFSIRYSYSVDGTDYDGSFLSGTSLSTGTKIKVLYDPDSPGKSKAYLYEATGTDGR